MARYIKSVSAAILFLILGADFRPAVAESGRGTAILEYRLDRTESHVLLRAGNRSWMKKLPPDQLIEQSVAGFIRESGRPTGNAEAMDRAAVRIAGELIPFRRELEAVAAERLIVVAEGALRRLSFEALRFDALQGRLVERFALSYASSARKAPLPERKCGGGDRSRLRAVGLVATEGASLTGAAGEIARIRRMFDRPGEESPAEPAFITDILRSGKKRFEVIHFAGHGRSPAGAPDGTAFVLRPGTGLDGTLTAGHIRGAGGVIAELVVLAACRTEGALSRSFLESGSRSVVATLWPVADRPTARLMAVFYARLKAGREKTEALREAKLAAIREGWAHPFYWAGFVLQGDPSGRISFR